MTETKDTMKVSSRTSVLAFDLGASSGRAIIGTLDRSGPDGPLLRMEEVHRFSNDPVQAGKHLYWDVLRLLHDIKQGLRHGAAADPDVRSFGIDTWGVDYGLLGSDGELLGNPVHYRDHRTDGVIEEVCGIMGAEALYGQTGLQFMPFNTVFQLFAAKKSGQSALDQAKELLFMPDLLAYLLTGERHCEYTIASTSQLLEPRTRKVHESLMDALGLPAGIVKEPVQPGTLTGKLLPSVTAELSVPALQSIAVAEHDTASAVVAVPAEGSQPFAYLSCGTWSLLGTELREPILDPTALECGFTNEGGVEGTYRFLKNIMGLWLIQECKREWDRNGSTHSFAELVQLAEQAPAFRSFINPDDLMFLHPGGMPGRIRQYCRDSGQPEPASEGEITRCIMESLALQYRLALDRLEGVTGERYGRLHIVGGGVNNVMLCRMTASAIGRPVWAGPVEGSALGNVAMQLIALGELKNMQEARDLIRRSYPVVTYSPEGSEQWNSVYAHYLSVTGQPLFPGE